MDSLWPLTYPVPFHKYLNVPLFVTSLAVNCVYCQIVLPSIYYNKNIMFDPKLEEKSVKGCVV